MSGFFYAKSENVGLSEHICTTGILADEEKKRKLSQKAKGKHFETIIGHCFERRYCIWRWRRI